MCYGYTERHPIPTEGVSGMTSGGKDAEARGKSSLTEKETRVVSEMEKTLHTELRSLNLILKIPENPMWDFKWDLKTQLDLHYRKKCLIVVYKRDQ